MVSGRKPLERGDSVTSRVLISTIRRASLFTEGNQKRKVCRRDQDDQDGLALEHLGFQVKVIKVIKALNTLDTLDPP